jgi:outer membrane lipopolysaccharide assembly protein LptE/RlpB
MSRIQNVYLLISCCIFLAMASCGYQFAGSGEVLPDVNRLFISLLENRSTETGIDVVLTDDLKNEFIHKYGGTLSERDQAAAILSGSITDIRTWTVSRTGALTSQERRISITVDVKLKNAAGETIRSAAGVSADETYVVVSGDKQATDQNKQNAILSLSKQLAEAVFHRLTEDF